MGNYFSIFLITYMILFIQTIYYIIYIFNIYLLFNLFFSNGDSTKMINQFYLYDKYASIYYAYNAIHHYMVRKCMLNILLPFFIN